MSFQNEKHDFLITARYGTVQAAIDNQPVRSIAAIAKALRWTPRRTRHHID